MIRVLLFDFDGTLVDSNAVKSACLDAVVAGLPGGPEALAKARALGGNRHKLFVGVARFLEAPGTSVDARALIAAYTACCRRGIASAPERAGTTRVLAALRARGIRLWLNSATPHRELLTIVRDRGLLPCFDGVLGGPAAKTSNIRRVLAAERIHPRQALMIGDGQDDLEAARSIGTWFVAVTAEGLSGRGPFAMRDLRNLLALVDRLRARRRTTEDGRRKKRRCSSIRPPSSAFCRPKA
jgi:phosphoglycolate phosphatase